MQSPASKNQSKPISFLKYVFKFMFQAFLLSVLLLFAVLLVFRWVPIPTSSFMQQQEHKISYQWVSWDEISPHLALAVLSSEDQRFPNHWGVDTIELKKALSTKGKPIRRGASTITQQVAKNLFLWTSKSYTRKGIEAVLAIALELTWPKQRILEVYLNVAQFGNGIFGAEEASKAFFDKPAKQLNKEESALLASVLPRPAVSNVNDPKPKLIKKQQWVLKQMKQLGGINYLNKL